MALYIAERIKSNIRGLEGSPTTLIARASLWRQKISLPLARDVLPNLGERSGVTGLRQDDDRNQAANFARP